MKFRARLLYERLAEKSKTQAESNTRDEMLAVQLLVVVLGSTYTFLHLREFVRRIMSKMNGS